MEKQTQRKTDANKITPLTSKVAVLAAALFSALLFRHYYLKRRNGADDNHMGATCGKDDEVPADNNDKVQSSKYTKNNPKPIRQLPEKGAAAPVTPPSQIMMLTSTKSAVLRALPPLEIPHSTSVIRAAFDVGSGSTKVLVGTVEGSSSHPNHQTVSKVLLEQQKEVLLRHALTRGKMLPTTATDQCFQVLEEFVRMAKDLGATEFVGVATAVFREANNGEHFLERVRTELGIPIFIASQVFEGRIGYSTAVHAARGTREQHIQRTPSKRRGPSREVLSWDSGGGSFQISNAQGFMYGGQVGSSSSLQIMMDLQGKTFQQATKASGIHIPSANPCTIHHCHELHNRLMSRYMPQMDTWLQEIMNGGVASGLRVVAIGGDTCAFRMCELAIGHHTFGIDDVWEAIEQHAGMDDVMLAELSFEQPEMLLPKLVLVYTVMKHTGIAEVEYHMTTGSTLGLLSISSEEIERHKRSDEQQNDLEVVGLGEHKVGFS
jgi:hypothetical protein